MDNITTLKSYVDALNFSEELKTLHALITFNGTTASTTFWGGRRIQVQGYKGSVSLKKIAERVLQADHNLSGDLDQESRQLGCEIVEKLQQFYKNTDKQFKKRMFITRIFCWFRDEPFTVHNTRFHIECADSQYRSYTEASFVSTYGSGAKPDGFSGKNLIKR